ncbi:hypothetical protein TKK_0019237 [Trichogramma kaykai]
MVVNMNPATLDEAIRAAGEVEADLTIRKSLLLANKDPPTRVHAIASEEKVEAPRLCFKCKQPASNGYVPRIDAGPGIFAGECLVTNANNKANLLFINATAEDVELTMAPVALITFDTIDKKAVRIARTVSGEANSASPDERVEKIMQSLALEGLNAVEMNSVREIVSKFPFQFHLPLDKLSLTGSGAHRIVTSDDIPINIKQYRYPPHLRDEMRKHVQEFIDNNIVEESESPYNFPLWIVPKKAGPDGVKKWRLAQVPIDPTDAHKTAFSTPFHHLQFRRMALGLKGSPGTFQALMDKVLTGLQGIELFIYMDDIVVYANSIQEHKEKMFRLMGRLRLANLTVRPDKCHFLKTTVTYLGHIISEKGVEPDPSKISAVSNFPRPKNRKNIKQFLGLAGYYRRFVKDFAKIAKPLTSLLKADTPWDWTDVQEGAFGEIKQILSSAPLLQYPDFNRPFVVVTDGSDFVISGILSQEKIGNDLPIAYTSRILTDAEINYSMIEKELLGIVNAPGRKNANADALSRNTVNSSASYSNDDVEHEIGRVFFILRPTTPESDSERDYALHGQNNGLQGMQLTIEVPTPDQNATTETNDATSGSTTEEASSDSPANESSPSACNEDAINDSASDESDAEDDATFTRSHPKRARLLVARSVQQCNDTLLTRKDNWVDLLKEHDIKLGLIIETGLPVDKSFSIFVKENHDDTVDIGIVNDALDRLADALKTYEIESISIPTNNNGIDKRSWEMISARLRETWPEDAAKLTLCSGEITTPDVESRPRIIRESHDSATAGHKGITKTYNRVREKNLWKGMKSEITDYVKSCPICQTKKLTRIKTRLPLTITTTPTESFELIEIDIVGPLPVTTSNNKSILTIQCNLTKFSEAIPLPDVRAELIATEFANEFICRYGCPKYIRTDQGQNLIGKVFSSLARTFKIIQFRSTSYRPQIQGSLERSHHSLIEYLKIFMNKDDWDAWILCALFSYNSSVHSGHGFTPHELVFGRKARIPSEFADKTIAKTFNEYLDGTLNRLNITQEQARENLIAAKERSKYYYDLKSHDREFKEGDYVYLLKSVKTSKLDDHYTGSYIINKLIGERNAELQLYAHKTKIVHLDKLKKACIRADNVRTPCNSAP